MNFGNIKNDDLDSIIKAFCVDRDIVIFKADDIPPKYYGKFLCKTSCLGATIGFQLEVHNGDTATPYLHNLNGPAAIEFNDYGFVSSIMYYVNNKLHNPFGPAIITYNSIKCKETEQYYIKGKLHNSIGPAIRSADYPLRNEYVINGMAISETRFFERNEVCKFKK